MQTSNRIINKLLEKRIRPKNYSNQGFEIMGIIHNIDQKEKRIREK
jgi:hypothetical protein